MGRKRIFKVKPKRNAIVKEIHCSKIGHVFEEDTNE